MVDREAQQGDDGLEIFEAPPAPAGSPAPTVAGEPAHPVVRAFAFALDAVGTVVLTTAVVFASVVAEGEFADFALGIPAAVAVVVTITTAVFGVTGGKALVGIRAVRADTGGRLGLWAIPRGLVISAPPLLTWLAAWILGRIPDAEYGTLLDAVVVPTIGLPLLALPLLLWIGMLAVLAVRPAHRGLQDLAGRSVVVHRSR